MRPITPLRRTAELQALKHHGASVEGRGLRMMWRVNRRRENRLGLRIQCHERKPTSTQRNRCRRLLRELYRRAHPRMPHGYDLLVIYTYATRPASFSQLQSAWQETLDAWLKQVAPPSSL